MDNPRLLLWIGLALLVWMNIIQWDRDHSAPAPVAATAEQTPAGNAAAPATSGSLPSLPSATATSATPAAGTPTLPGAVAPTDAAATAPTIRVVTDVIDMDISLQGGELLRADLLQYPRDKKPGSAAVRLLSTDDLTYGTIRSGLRVADGRPEPTHLASFTAPATEFRLAPGASELRVPLTWTDGQGVTVTKTYVFRPGQYTFDVVYDVQNASATDWNAASYVQFVRHMYSQER